MRILPDRPRTPATTVLGLLAVLAVAACNAPPPPPPPVSAPASSAATATASGGDAQARLGNVTARVSAIQTSLLADAVARQYGITRDPKSVLLLVALAPAEGGSAQLPSATVRATVTDLRGGRTDMAMRAVPADGSVDWIGVTATSLPDTLRFDVTITAGDSTAQMQIQREFYPR